MQLSYARLTIAITLATVLFNCIGTVDSMPAQPSYDEGLYRLADLIENEHNNIKISGKVTPISPELKIFKGTYEKENIVYSAYITCASKEASSSTLLFYKDLLRQNIEGNIPLDIKEYMAVPMYEFSIEDKHCYVTLAVCEKNQLEYRRSEYVRNGRMASYFALIRKKNRVVRYLRRQGWVLDMNVRSTCINNIARVPHIFLFGVNPIIKESPYDFSIPARQ